MNGDLGKKYLREYSERTKPLLRGFLEEELVRANALGEVPEKMIVDFMDLCASGKGIRGALVTLGYKAFGGPAMHEIDKLSLFIELVHTGLLVQDDFMDRDVLRRGKETIHKRFEKTAKKLNVLTPSDHYGISIATDLGDVSFYFSWKVLMSSDFPFDNLKKATEIYIKYLIDVCYGQALDMTITGNKNVSEKDVLQVLHLKTGEYTSLLPLEVGAALAGAHDETKMKALRNYAVNFGWAFQIQDDILGIFGEEAKLGKPIGSDIKEGKNTLLTLHLRKHATKEQLEFVDYALGNQDITEDDVKKFKQLLKEVGSYEYVVNKGWDYVNKGIDYVDSFVKDSELSTVFKSLIYYMMERTL